MMKLQIPRLFPKTLKTILLFSGALSAAIAGAQEIKKYESCPGLLQKNTAFLSGRVTDSGKSPEQFFGDTKFNSRPRFVIMVGVPGGGKSTWTKAATTRGWEVVENDAIRQKLLTELKAEGGKVTVEESDVEGKKIIKEEVPNILDPRHLFSSKYLPLGIQLGNEAILKAFSEGRSVISDAVNGNPSRVKMMLEARKHGYSVEALIFMSDSAEANISNVNLRASQGGFKLEDFKIRMIWKAVKFYNSELRVDPSFFPNTVPAAPALDMGAIFSFPDKFSTLTEALAALPAEHRQAMEATLDLQIFNQAEYVHTPNFAAPISQE